MPPPMVKCSICGEMVMKSQTCATGGMNSEGVPVRACKTHEGVVEKAEDFQKKQEEEKQKKIKEDQERKQTRNDPFGLAKKFDGLCWCCQRRGISRKDSYLVQLLALEKARVLGDPNPFSKTVIDEGRKIMKKTGAECVFDRFNLTEDQYKNYLRSSNRIAFEMREIVLLGRFIQLCTDCQKGLGIMFDIEARMPKPNLETMAILGAGYEASGAKANMQAIAESLVKEDVDESTQKN